MKNHCIIVTRNMVEAEDLGELVSEQYKLQVHKFRDARKAQAKVDKLDGFSLAFLSVEYEEQEMTEMMQSILHSGAKVILIDGPADGEDGPIGLLRRPYSSDDISRIMDKFQ